MNFDWSTHTELRLFYDFSVLFCWLSSARPVDSATLLMCFLCFVLFPLRVVVVDFVAGYRSRWAMASLCAKLSAFGDFVRLNHKLSNEKNIIRLLIEPAQHTKIEKSFEQNSMNWKGWLKSPLKIALNKGRVFFCSWQEQKKTSKSRKSRHPRRRSSGIIII